jgi:zinc D-Ala-D-Ala carboxypeptidase
MRLSPHFYLAELARTDTGLDNTPPEYILDRLFFLAYNMERVREVLRNKPINITSGWRSDAVNEAVGGVKNSDHRNAYVCDFKCPAFGSPYEICKEILLSRMKFDQLIQERGKWVHISFAPVMRRQVLTLPKIGNKYLSGLHE